MYEFALIVHSVLRWVVVIAGAYAVGRAVAGMTAGRSWAARDASPGRVFAITFDVQLLVGLLLYGFLSPFVASALANMGEAMKSADLRYWAVEHPLPMFVALVLAHIGVARARRPTASHRQALIYFGLALVLVLVSTPWPFTANSRPLLW